MTNGPATKAAMALVHLITILCGIALGTWLVAQVAG
jgi:cytochrome oxidase assembly protein ShyY1